MWHDKKSESPSKITQGLTFFNCLMKVTAPQNNIINITKGTSCVIKNVSCARSTFILKYSLMLSLAFLYC